MSYQAVEWALYKAPMLLTDKGKPDTTARQVLAVLAEHADTSGRNARPSVLRIRFATGLDERTVERALLRLQRGELIAMTGRTMTGTRRWNLAMKIVRPESEWDDMAAEADAVRTAESERRKARRHRSSCADDEPSEESVRDAESRISGTQSTDVRDAESRRPGRNAPRTISDPPVNRSGSTTPGGAPPPDPSRRPPPPASATEQRKSPTDPLTPAQDQQGDSLPHTRTREHGPPDRPRLADVIPIENWRSA